MCEEIEKIKTALDGIATIVKKTKESIDNGYTMEFATQHEFIKETMRWVDTKTAYIRKLNDKCRS